MSIKEIARRAGVSPSTVSRVLNDPNYRCSRPEIRETIWRLARELNYVPNEAARNLKKGVGKRSGKTYYVSILMTRVDNSRSDPFFNELLHIIESEIHRHMCVLTKIWYYSLFSDDKRCRSENLDKIIRKIRDETGEKCDGLIIIGKCNKEALKRLRQGYRSVVAVNRDSADYGVDEVVCDGRKVASMAVEYLIQLGHKRIAYVGKYHNEPRYLGFLDALHRHNIELAPECVLETKQTEVEGYEAMESLLKSEDCPTGIYCANDITAIGMLKCLAYHKKRYFMPSIISCDDIEDAQYSRPMLTTVRLPKEEMGRFALFLLLDHMRGGHKGAVRVELEGKLMVRESCTPASESRWCDYYI